jgi:DNA uptake protein ComE-like DNA-binding protein
MKYSLSMLLVVTVSIIAVGCTDKSMEQGTTMAGESTMEPMNHSLNAAGTTKLNLNKASLEEFKTVPGMTDRMVREFDEYRPYASIQQFRREIGKYVSEDVVAGYEEFVFVPVDPNNSDAETLMQIPGIDASVVEEIDAARPFDSPEAFVDFLVPMVSNEELAVVASFLTEQ